MLAGRTIVEKGERQRSKASCGWKTRWAEPGSSAHPILSWAVARFRRPCPEGGQFAGLPEGCCIAQNNLKFGRDVPYYDGATQHLCRRAPEATDEGEEGWRRR